MPKTKAATKSNIISFRISDFVNDILSKDAELLGQTVNELCKEIVLQHAKKAALQQTKAG